MKKHPIHMLACMLCLFSFWLSQASASDYMSVNMPLKVNNLWYTGPAPVCDANGDTYYPLEALADALDISFSISESAVQFGEIFLPSGRYIMLDGRPYGSESILREAGVHLYIQTDSVSYIDNFPVLDYAWAENNRIVAHAMGGYDSHSYTNSLNAFEYNYDLGHRVFEVDFTLSADGVLLALHEWRDAYLMIYGSGEEITAYEPMTVDEFTNSYFYESLLPMTVDDVIMLMASHPDIYIITDTKAETDDDLLTVFEEIIAAAEYYDPSVLERIIPQLYSIDMYDLIFDLYDWRSAVFTMYRCRSPIHFDEVFDFTYRHGIKAITANSGKLESGFSRNVKDSGGYLYVHTYNSLDSLRSLADARTIWGVYTDFLAPDALDDLPYPLSIPEEVPEEMTEPVSEAAS